MESCDDLVLRGKVPTTDSDISGIGVILAFLLSAYVTFASILAAYVFGCIDDDLLRPVDRYIHKVNSDRTKTTIYETLQKCVLLLSDQQIVTGIAILIPGFIGLAHEMSVYHFQIVIYLSWMASSVHLSALTMLATFLGQHRAVRGWRLAGMGILFALLLVALVPTASNLWALGNLDHNVDKRTGWGVPAKCYFFRNHGFGVNPDAPLSYLLLLLSYIWKVAGLFSGPRSWFRYWIRGPPEYLLESMLHRLAVPDPKKARTQPGIRYKITMVFYVWMFSQFELFSSFAASLHLSWIGLVFGTIQIAIPREQNLWWNYRENSWSFGQIVPLVLLIQPLGALLEHDGANADLQGSAPISSSMALTSFSLDGAKSRPERGRISAMLAEYEPQKPKERPLSLLQHQEAIFKSKIFKFIILGTEIGVTGVCAFTFWFDAETIGNTSTSNWYGMVVGIGFLVAATLATILVSVPFSRLFR